MRESTSQPDVAADQGPATRRSGLGLQGRTMLMMLSIGLTPLLAFGGWALVQQTLWLRDGARASLQASSAQIATGVDDWLDKNVRALDAAASLPALTSMRPAEQAPALAAVQQAYPWIYLVHTMGPDGMNVARSDGKPPNVYSDRQYFKDVMGGKAPAWETLIGKTSNKPALVIAVPIRAEGRVVGVLAAAMTIEDISKIVARWTSGHTGFAFLVDEKAKVVAHPRAEFVLEQRYLTDHPLVSSFFHGDGRPVLVDFEADGSEVLGAAQGSRFHWAVAVQQDRAELFEPLRRTLGVGLGLFALAAVAVAVAARVSASRLIRPIVSMTEAANRMSLGDLLRPIRIERTDELGMLAHALERLRKSLKAAMSKLQGSGGAASSTRL